ncbi:MAG: A/G-specific adenine glycosylase [Acidobacteriaceae bacterium]|nr:A/G-specific adenine glycosylase [Acidobacteriaceae bacterium]
MKQTELAGDATETTRWEVNPMVFRRRLMKWYRANARVLPWRGITDPYRTWVSEIMLQQTRVAAVIDYYNEFLRRFPTLVSLALAEEEDVLAAWSGLGYYNRARLLHKSAQFIVEELQGYLPPSAAELLTLPGIGEYTAAAIASIAFGESVAVVDGNVERVILRLSGRASETTAAARAQLRAQAQALMPKSTAKHWPQNQANARRGTKAKKSSVPMENAAGDHNQAMMELGATICLVRAPLCRECPVRDLCLTRGEHVTPARAPQRSLPLACLLDLRKRGPATEVLLELRPADAAVMPAMYELPSLPIESVGTLEPALRLRHSITNTNYYVQVYSLRRHTSATRSNYTLAAAKRLHKALSSDSRELKWTRTASLASLPLTGLARKILQRLQIMDAARLLSPQESD